MTSSKNCVLITGASSGIGREFANRFAKEGYDLILVARSQKELESLAHELADRFGIFVKVIVQDLSIVSASQKIYTLVKASGLNVSILISNAGFGSYGKFSELDLASEIAQVQVNVTSLTHLTGLFLPEMLKRKSGKILHVASTAAFLPGPLMAVYFATKAYVLSFSEALAQELVGSGVSVTALCPGPTQTGFATHASASKSSIFKGRLLKVEEVVDQGFKGLMSGQTIVIPGILNKLTTFGIRFLPRSLVAKYVYYAQREV